MAADSTNTRRSDRLWLTIPLRVMGTDSSGQKFECSGRAINLNRYGGRLQVTQILEPGLRIRLRNPMGPCVAEFRVVETIPTDGEVACECGVECLNDEINFWGIEFPAVVEEKGHEAKVLLECRSCHTVAFVSLAFLEVATLSTINMVGLECPKCEDLTFWQFAEVRVPVQRELEWPLDTPKRESNWIAALSDFAERGHRRAYVQMALGLNDCCGNSDAVLTENISECGFCFSTERKYLQGEVVTAAFPVAAMTDQTQLPARIVREWVMEGSSNKFYAATFNVGRGGCHGV